MSVDREGNAWVLYSSGQIFKVPVVNPSTCTNSGFSPGTSGYQLMGMGFVATSAGAQTEHLYIAGGRAGRANASGNIGYIDPATLQVTTVGTFTAQTYGPELTGTGDAKLYGYFPDTGNTRVVQIDPATGAEGQSWPLPGAHGLGERLGLRPLGRPLLHLRDRGREQRDPDARPHQQRRGHHHRAEPASTHRRRRGVHLRPHDPPAPVSPGGRGAAPAGRQTAAATVGAAQCARP